MKIMKKGRCCYNCLKFLQVKHSCWGKCEDKIRKREKDSVVFNYELCDDFKENLTDNLKYFEHSIFEKIKKYFNI